MLFLNRLNVWENQACGPAIPLIGLAISAFSTIEGMSQAKKNEQNQEDAARTAEQNAASTQKAAQEATNQANQKSPNTAAIQGQQQVQAQAGGGGATMLSGPQGVDPNKLALGKNTLLGA